MSSFFGVPEANQLLSGWNLSPLKSSRTACPVDRSHADNFDISVHAEYTAATSSHTYMSAVNGVPMWYYYNQGFFKSVGGDRLTFAYYKLGNSAALGDWHTAALSSASEATVMLNNGDATLMNRGMWHFNAEASGENNYIFTKPNLFYYDAAGHVIPRQLSPSSMEASKSSSPLESEYWVDDFCLPFAVGIGMWAPVGSGSYFNCRLRGYRDGTTPNFALTSSGLTTDTGLTTDL